jgi:hypothetical protein
MTDISAENPGITARLKTEIVANMHPTLSAFYIWITRSLDGVPKNFSGTITLPDGLESVNAFELIDSDTWSVEGNTLTFSISSSMGFLGPVKHIVIIPTEGSETLVANVQIENGTRQDLFFPYGNRTPAESSEVTVRLSDYPLGFDLPYSYNQDFEGFYIWGTRKIELGNDSVELDEQTREQLRSLGYLGQ